VADQRNLPLEEIMIVCDLCGQAKECLQKEIEAKVYDICSECWNPLEAKLKGKGRIKKERESVFSPPPLTEPEPQEEKPVPGRPPKIWGEGCNNEFNRSRSLTGVPFPGT
jgi:hypothetical protein